MRTEFNWQGVYDAAMLETDNRVLAQRIQDAQVAIEERARHLKSSSPGYSEEQRAIFDALHNLAMLRRELDRATA